MKAHRESTIDVTFGAPRRRERRGTLARFARRVSCRNRIAPACAGFLAHARRKA